jgi:hypothetical protein
MLAVSWLLDFSSETREASLYFGSACRNKGIEIGSRPLKCILAGQPGRKLHVIIASIVCPDLPFFAATALLFFVLSARFRACPKCCLQKRLDSCSFSPFLAR